MRLLAIIFLTAAVLTSGCATAVRGTTEPVTFISDPAGAKMVTTTGQSCVTPCTLEIPRSDTFTATFTLDDQTEKVFVDTEVSDDAGATTAANVLFTPIIAIPVAIAVDATSGANLDHTPNPVKVAFKNVAKVGSDEYEQAAQTITPTAEAESNGNSGTTLAAAPATAPEKPPEPELLAISITLDANNSYWHCPAIKERLPELTLTEETPSWQDVSFRRAPDLTLKARIRQIGETLIVDVWPHSTTWRETESLSVPLTSLETGTQGRTYSNRSLELNGVQCGAFALYATVEPAG